MPHLHIRLLGDFLVLAGGKPIQGLHRARLQSFLAYLLLHRRAPQSRHQLAFLFWPDSTEKQAQTNLRKMLHHLRHILPDAARYLHNDTKTVQWAPDAPFILDIAEFENKTAQAQTAGQNGDASKRAALLTEAVALYQGEFMRGCYDDWILTEREQLHQQCLAALEQLMGWREETRDYPAAIRHGQRLLALDSLHEITYQRLMRLYALSGDRAGALRVYHTCADVLERELGVEPAADTQAMYTRLLQQEAPAPLPEQLPQRTGSTKLVGRETEWRQLLSGWRVATTVRAHVVLVIGEAGIGKTRLVEELRGWVMQQGFTTAHSRAYGAAGDLAYTPIIDWLHQEPFQTALMQLDPIWRSEVARLLPDLLVQDPNLPRPEPLTERWQRQRLFEALTRVVRLAKSPLLLALDDLQWCDVDTLEWLRYLLNTVQHETKRQQSSTSLLVVGTARSEEMDPEHPLNTLLFELHGTGQVTEVALGPLSAAETAELAAQMTSTALSEATSGELYIQTEGNPLFIVETMRADIEDPSRQTKNQSSLPQASSANRQFLPEKVQAVIQYRLAQLSLAARTLVSLAAAIGRSFTFDLLQAASDEDESELVRNLDELWQRGIVRAQGSQAYDFSHDRIRETAYAEVSPVQRPMLHRRVAKALERVYADDLDPVSAQLAEHFEQAGMVVEAIRYCQRAAQVAAGRYDHTNAIALIDTGLRLVRAQPQMPESINLQLSLLLAKIESLTVVAGFAVHAVSTSCAELEALLPQIDNNQLLFQAYGKLRTFYGVSGQMALAHTYATRILELASQLQEANYLLFAYGVCGTVNLQMGRFAIARAYLEQAEALYKREATTKTEQTISYNDLDGLIGTLAFTLCPLGYPDQAFAMASEATALTKNAGEGFEIGVARFYASLVYQHVRAVDLAAASAEHELSLNIQYGSPIPRASGMVMRGWVMTQHGSLIEGMASLRAGIDEFKAMNHAMFQSHRLAWLAEAQMQAERWTVAGATLDEGFAMSDQSGQRSGDAELHRLQGEWLVQHQQFSAAQAAFHQAIEIARTQEAKSFELRAVMSLCRLWQQQGKQAEAHALLAAIYNWFTEGFDTADLQAAKTLLDELQMQRSP